MPSKPAPMPARLPALAWVLALALLPARPAPARPPAPQGTTEGLDVLLLVDVSRSMFSDDQGGGDGAAHGPNGSDPDRLRWDAVQLALNLLTAEDRVLILPFNHQAPALVRYANGQADWIPGGLPQQLLPVSASRAELRAQVETFIHSRGVPLPNTDSGGTAILGALARAADLTQADSPPPGRRRAVILLTDGREDQDQLSRFPGAERETGLRSYLGPWARAVAGRPATPVYAIGLGSEQAVEAFRIDLDYLRRIANLTGGNSIWVRRNSQLIETFRDLIWQLKGCWIKGVDMASQRATDDTMRGIVDLGILAYAERPGGLLPDGRPDPRNTGPPSSRLEFRWTAGDDQGPPADGRTGKGGDTYAYTYFGRPSPAEKSPFQVFADAALKLSSTWTPPALGHRIAFAKRTVRPLLEIVEPAEFRSLSRHQELTVRLRLSDTPYFQPEQFRLTMGLTPEGQEMAAAAAEVKQALEVEPNARTFRGSIRLDRLKGGRGPKDYYTLRLLAEGLRDPLHALSSYRLELPRRTIAVENTVVLAPVGRVELSREARSHRLTIRSLAAISGELPLTVTVTPPRSKQGPVPLEALIVRQDDPAGEEGTVRLRDGTAVLEVALNRGPLPPGGVAYQDGRLELTARAGAVLEPLSIPLGLRIDLLKLVSNPAECRLEAKPELNRSPSIRILADSPGGLPPEAPDAHIALAAQGDGVQFAPEELWLEPVAPAEGPGAVPGARSSALDLPLDTPFRIVFQPKPDPAKLGRHSYTWTVTARGANPVSGALTLDYQTPSLVGPDRPIVVHTGRDTRHELAIPLRLAGLQGDTRRVVFRPDRRPDGLGVFSREGGPAGGAAGQEPGLEIPSPAEAVEVVCTGAGSEGAVMRLGLTIPGDLPLGHYRARGVLAGVKPDVTEAKVELEVVVNALEVLAMLPGREGSWTPCDRVEIGPFFDAELVQVVRVRTGLRDRLRPEQVRVTIPGPFDNHDGDLIHQLPAPASVRDVRILNDGEELEMTIRFPPVVSADPFKPYSVSAYFDYFESPERPLDHRVVEFVVTFLDARFSGPPRPR